MVERRKQKDLISVRVTTKFKKQLIDIAEEKGITLPDLVRYILTRFIEKESAKNTTRGLNGVTSSKILKDGIGKILVEKQEKEEEKPNIIVVDTEDLKI